MPQPPAMKATGSSRDRRENDPLPRDPPLEDTASGGMAAPGPFIRVGGTMGAKAAALW